MTKCPSLSGVEKSPLNIPLPRFGCLHGQPAPPPLIKKACSDAEKVSARLTLSLWS